MTLNEYVPIFNEGLKTAYDSFAYSFFIAIGVTIVCVIVNYIASKDESNKDK